jgi:Spy/CpxP family protein refolding chaperone
MPGMHKRGDMLGMLIKHADKVGLSGEQVAKLKGIHRVMEKKKIRSEADMKLTRIDLKEIMEVKDFDLEKANAAVQKISDIKRDQHLEMLKSMKDVRSILTDEQFKKIKDMKHRMWEGKKPGGKKPEMKKQKEHHQE